MKAFAKCVAASRKEPDRNAPRVKIAVLDTGVDLTHPDIIEARQDGRIQCHDFVEDSSQMLDLDGHGTHCTSLLLKFAPNAEIYVGRVFRKSEAEESSCVVLANVRSRGWILVLVLTCLQAIRHAADIWGVDILSLSLGFIVDDDGVQDAIRKANANNVLIFAAAANNTTNEVTPIRFPARMKDVFCIFASNAYGRPSDFNPPPRYDRENFTFPGEKIEGAWPSSLADEKAFERRSRWYKYQDGTSCATPIAAAIAAGVLEFAWQEREHQIRRVKLLSHFSGMSDVFLNRMVDRHRAGDGRYLYVKPWKMISTSARKEEIPVLISDTLDHVNA
jgi:subtilisin family serine protease